MAYCGQWGWLFCQKEHAATSETSSRWIQTFKNCRLCFLHKSVVKIYYNCITNWFSNNWFKLHMYRGSCFCNSFFPDLSIQNYLKTEIWGSLMLGLFDQILSSLDFFLALWIFCSISSSAHPESCFIHNTSRCTIVLSSIILLKE